MKPILIAMLGLILTISTLSAQTFPTLEKTVPSLREAHAEFGYSLALSGDLAVVGSWKEDLNAFGQAALPDAVRRLPEACATRVFGGPELAGQVEREGVIGAEGRDGRGSCRQPHRRPRNQQDQ